MDISFKRSCPGFGKADEDTLTAAREFVDPDAVHINQRQHISNVHQLQLCFPVRKKDGGWWLLFFRLQNSKQIWRMFQNYLILMQNTCHNCLFSSFPPELFFLNFQECKMRSNIFFSRLNQLCRFNRILLLQKFPSCIFNFYLFLTEFHTAKMLDFFLVSSDPVILLDFSL